VKSDFKNGLDYFRLELKSDIDTELTEFESKVDTTEIATFQNVI